jgi:hypothetical protein
LPDEQIVAAALDGPNRAGEVLPPAVLPELGFAGLGLILVRVG